MPVYESHIAARADLRLGGRIRDERQRRRVTLQQLAARTRLSTACLSQIENEQRAVDISQALVIADALGVPMLSFLPSDASVPYQLTRDEELRARAPREVWITSMRTGERRADVSAFWPVADLFVGRQLEPILGLISGSDDAVRYCHHHEHEFTFVLKGAVRFHIRTPEGVREDTLHQGDCVYFVSSIPHCLRSLTPEPAEILQLFSSAGSPVNTGIDWSSPFGVGLLEDDEDQDEQIDARVGKEMAFLRAARGWSLARMARLLDIKESQLKQIESGERAVTLATLVTLARVLEKPVRELVRDPLAPGPFYAIQRSSDLSSLRPKARRMTANGVASTQTHQFYSLASVFAGRQMHPYFVRLPSGPDDQPVFQEHHGQEFFYVLEGQVELTTRQDGRERVEILKTGDSAYLDATVPHALRGQSRNPYSSTSAEVIVVFSCSLGESYLFED